MKRKISALLVLAMLSGLVSGCGTAENSDCIRAELRRGRREPGIVPGGHRRRGYY